MNANLISQEQALSILSLAKAESLLTGNHLGSIIQKHMTLKQLSNVISDPNKDFFYVKDDEESIRLFMKYCVMEEKIDE